MNFNFSEKFWVFVDFTEGFGRSLSMLRNSREYKVFNMDQGSFEVLSHEEGTKRIIFDLDRKAIFSNCKYLPHDFFESTALNATIDLQRSIQNIENARPEKLQVLKHKKLHFTSSVRLRLLNDTHTDLVEIAESGWVNFLDGYTNEGLNLVTKKLELVG